MMYANVYFCCDEGGSLLDIAGVALIRSHYRKNPPLHGIFIQVSDV